MQRVGLISDTHGLLRPEAESFLRGCDAIVHGGDIGGPHILSTLEALAPVTAVRGNNDSDAWADALPVTQWLKVDEVCIHVIHDLSALAIDPGRSGVRVVVSGHSHKPRIDERGGVLYINPGSAGPRRFSLPISVAELRISGAEVTAHLVDLGQMTSPAPPPEKATRVAPILPAALAALAREYTRDMPSIRGRRVQRLLLREFSGAEQVLLAPLESGMTAVLGLSAHGAALCATDGRGRQATVAKWLHGSGEAFETQFDLHKDSLPALHTAPLSKDRLRALARLNLPTLPVGAEHGVRRVLHDLE